MALITLPLVLHAVDVALSPSESLVALKQHRLNIFLEIMKMHELQYDGLQLIREVIHNTVTCIKSKNTRMDSWPFAIQNAHPPQQQSSSLPEAPEQSQVSISDWGEMVSVQQRCYLRLALTIDLAFSRGKFPDNADFPVCLQGNTARDVFAVGQNHSLNLATNSHPQQGDMRCPSRMPFEDALLASCPDYSIVDQDLLGGSQAALNFASDSGFDDTLPMLISADGG
ncbi:hypothetical protein ACEPPN_007465 [Leptodophora sp. 'Broadleaf-Isolate-01']